jgi:hypothetical protein
VNTAAARALGGIPNDIRWGLDGRDVDGPRLGAESYWTVIPTVAFGAPAEIHLVQVRTLRGSVALVTVSRAGERGAEELADLARLMVSRIEAGGIPSCGRRP